MAKGTSLASEDDGELHQEQYLLEQRWHTNLNLGREGEGECVSVVCVCMYM